MFNCREELVLLIDIFPEFKLSYFFSDGVEVIEDGDDDEEAADEGEEEPTKAKTAVNGSSEAPVVVNGSKEGGGGE